MATIDLRPSWGAITRLSRSGKTPRHPVTSGCRGAPVACAARERPLTVARKDDRVRNLAGFEGIGGVRAALVGIPGRAVSSTSTRRKHAVGGWSPEHRPRRRDRRRGRPGGARLSPPLPSVATALDSRCPVCSRPGAERSRRSICSVRSAVGGSRSAWGKRVKLRVRQGVLIASRSGTGRGAGRPLNARSAACQPQGTYVNAGERWRVVLGSGAYLSCSSDAAPCSPTGSC